MNNKVEYHDEIHNSITMLSSIFGKDTSDDIELANFVQELVIKIIKFDTSANSLIGCINFIIDLKNFIFNYKNESKY